MFGQQLDNNTDDKKEKIAYARVSSAKQQEDLQRQVEALKQAYPQHQVVTDVGSGLNWQRKGLRTVLERALRGMVSEVVVMHKDRLCRFGFELIDFVLQQSGAKLLVHSPSDDHVKTNEQELAEDLLSIVTVFAARNHGKRKYRAGSKTRSPKRPRKTKEPRQEEAEDTATELPGGDEEDSGVSNDGAAPDNLPVAGRSPVDLQ